MNFKIMKKYKLIKEYPNSPIIDTTVEEREFGYEVLVAEQTNGLHLLKLKYSVEKYPEFWEKIHTLNVPLGTKFRSTDTSDPCINTIESIVDDRIRIHVIWERDGYTTYSICEANELFNSKSWIVYDEDDEPFISKNKLRNVIDQMKTPIMNNNVIFETTIKSKLNL